MLEEEHRLILRMVKVLTVMKKRLEQGESIDASVLRDTIDFFRSFADKGHHARCPRARMPDWNADE
jgi:hemerythrin-like domain-containing protein